MEVKAGREEREARSSPRDGEDTERRSIHRAGSDRLCRLSERHGVIKDS